MSVLVNSQYCFQSVKIVLFFTIFISLQAVVFDGEEQAFRSVMNGKASFTLCYDKLVNLFLPALISCLSSGHPAYSWPNGLADSHKLNLGRELRWVANGLASVLTIKTISRQTYPVIHWLIGYYNNKKMSLNLHWFKLGGQTVKNFLRRACKFDFN